MSIAAATARVSYTGNGATSVYAYTFKIAVNTQIRVIKRLIASPYTESTLVLTTDYTVSGVGDAGGGNVTLVAGALASTYTLELLLLVPVTQPTSIRNQGAYYPTTHEDALDYLARVNMQQQDQLNRSIRQPESEAPLDMELPCTTSRASKYMAFDSDGKPTVTEGTTSDIVVSSFMETVVDDSSAADVISTMQAALTEETSPAVTDSIHIYDLSNTAGRKATLGNAFKVINGLTEDTAPTVSDELPTYDSSASGPKKATIQRIVDLVLSTNQGAKNNIINGNFDLWQRNTTFTSIANGANCADRFQYVEVGASVHDAIRSTDVPTLAESGFQSTYSLLIDCTTADASVAAGDLAGIRYKMEGYDFAQLINKQVTLSFWVKATITGIHCVAFSNSGSDRTYVAEYTISVADTWEKKTITLTLNPTGGTNDFTTGIGLAIRWTLMAGSTFQTTASAWNTGDFWATSNQVNQASNAANNFRIAQVMLNVGQVAAPFMRAGGNIPSEVDLCQRYFEKSYSLDVAPGTVTDIGYIRHVSGHTASAYVPVYFRSTKRVVPTPVIYSTVTGAAAKIRNLTGAADADAATIAVGVGAMNMETAAGVTAGEFIAFQWAADSEL